MKLLICSKHGSVSHFKRLDGSFRCGKCVSLWVTNHRRKKKEKLVELFGGKCLLCGYKRYFGSLDFHHKDPKEKDFSISVKGLSYGWDQLFMEAQKCFLLCKNCHAEVEAGISSVKDC